jgi:hypothetical protein
MTPEEEQKLRNFRLLGGGSSMELPQQQQPIASILGQAGSGGFGTNPNQFFGPGFGFRNRMAKDGVMAYRADTGERALDFEENAVRNYANMGNRSPQLNMPTITAQVPGIENITLGQAPIVSQEGIQYQTPDVFSNIGFAISPSILGQVPGIENITLGQAPIVSQEGIQYQTPEEEIAQMQTYEQAQGLPPIQLEALERLSPQPEATFTLPSGEVRSIMPGQDVASAFGRESGRPMTFQVDGGEVTVPSAQAIQTMNLGEQAAARQAQQEFLASPAAREMSNRMLRSVMYNDPYAQASAERVARMEAKPDFNRAVSDRERRGTGEMSMASATKLTGGDRDKARAMIELQRQGRDPMTGKEVEEPFEPKEIEISGNKYIQLTPNYIQPVEEPKAPKKSEIESIREEGVKAGLPENLIRQSIASKLGLDIYDEGVKNWMAGNTDTMPSVEGASESSTFDPTSLTGQDKEAYDWAMANPNAPQSAQILARLSK